MAEKLTLKEKLELAKQEAEANREAESLNASSVTNEEAKIPIRKEAPKPVKQFNLTDMVEVTNNTHGRVIYTSKRSGLQWIWEDFGYTDWMEIQELQHMRSSQPSFFKEAWLRPTDPDVIEFLRLTHFYKDILEEEDIDTLFSLSAHDVEDAIDKSPTNVKIMILDKARKLYEAGELNNVHILKVIEKKFHVDFADNEE